MAWTNKVSRYSQCQATRQAGLLILILILLNVFNRMLGHFLRQLFDDDALVLHQSSSTAVDREDVPDLLQHLVVAVDPVEILVSNVDLRAARSHQSPVEFLLCSEFLQPGEISGKSGYGSFENGLEIRLYPSSTRTHTRADSLKNFELWDDLFLENAENELLKIVTFFRDGGLQAQCNTCMYMCMYTVCVHT